ncbi:MAG: response regulator transcription factor [Bacteroidota bacterium]|nr:DNA-binding response regulator [Odoribacter sp.]MDP3643045.1 response regulator transcription factor [Bacteroidota bacterium]
MNTKPFIFLVEDDLSFGAVLKSYLEISDFDVVWVDDGQQALNQFKKASFNICILDVMLPNVDGFTIATEIRKLNTEIPILFLTAKNMREDVLKGYRIGADDYITKPFDTEVLIFKLKAILKRQSGSLVKESGVYQIGSYSFDFKLRTLEHDGLKQKLSPKEAELLKMLCDNLNELLPREIALKKIWGDDGYFTARSMDVYLTKIRKLFAEDPSIEIRNIHGSGFMLEIKNS